MNLKTYLKQFNNIVWYPSAHKDFMPLTCLSNKQLYSLGIKKDDLPDCFIFTDYLSYSEYEPRHKFFLDLDDDQVELVMDDDSRQKTTIFNIHELQEIKIGFDLDMTAFSRDEYYGKVYTGDVLVEHPKFGKNTAKLIYIVVENTKFAFEFLLSNHIKVKYVIHNCYGHGFGCGRSNGAFLLNILKELETKYLISDYDNYYDIDVADIYLNEEERNLIPVLKEITNFTNDYCWGGYGETSLFEVINFIKGESTTHRYIIDK